MSGVRVKYTARFKNGRVDGVAGTAGDDEEQPPLSLGWQGCWGWRTTSSGWSRQGCWRAKQRRHKGSG